MVNISGLATEKRNEKTRDLDLLSTRQIIEIMNEEDLKVIEAVKGSLDEIEMLIKECIRAYEDGGRIIYIGAGTSGRLGLMDAVEVIPTFNCDRFIGLIVHKRWFAYSGVEMDGSDRDPITVRLYASTDPTGLTEPVLVEPTEYIENPIILGPDNDWSYTWGNLPTMDDDGNIIYYFVAEDPVPGFTPVYINNGTCGGSIVISNNCEPMELPETGSNASGIFVALGVAMILLASAVYIKSKFKMEVTK